MFCNIVDIELYPTLEYPLQYAQQWHRIADRIVQTMSSPSSSASSTNISYVGLHLRREADLCRKQETKPKFEYCKWNASQWMDCIQSYMVPTTIPRDDDMWSGSCNECDAFDE
jgi:hypothetical protein